MAIESSPRTLLVYEDRPALSPLLQEQLENWRVQRVQAGEERMPANAVLLANGEGHAAIAADLRAGGMIGPIFSLGEAAAAPLIGLSKPFRISTFLNRLQAQDLAWIDGAIIGKWRLDATQKALIDGERLERLTDKELAMLQLLLVSAPSAVDRETLQTEIWRYHVEADTHTVETHVWRLRQKLEADPGAPELLVTVADGYTLQRLPSNSTHPHIVILDHSRGSPSE